MRSLAGGGGRRSRPSSQVDPFEADGGVDSEKLVPLSRSREGIGIGSGSPKIRAMPSLMEREPNGRASSIVRPDILVEAMSELEEDGEEDSPDNSQNDKTIGEEKEPEFSRSNGIGEAGNDVINAPPRDHGGSAQVMEDLNEGNDDNDGITRVVDDMLIRRTARTVS